MPKPTVTNTRLILARPVGLAALMVLLCCVSACETLGFYGQAIKGQLGVLSQRENIEHLLASTDTDQQLRARLELVQDIRMFAEQKLSLPVGKSYSSYVDLQRLSTDNFVVWNVFAAPELSLNAHTWCYPLIGCAAYRGYFSRESAQRYAQRMQQQGLDVYVGGVKAYSTLGWFADPVLSSFMAFDEARLAALLFHELAHKVVYIRDNTEFNESFASAVEEEGLRRWLQSRQQLSLLAQVEGRQRARENLLAQVGALRAELETVYQDADATRTEKLANKERLFARFSGAVERMHSTESWRRWARQLRSNASLVPIQSYNRWQNAFAQLLLEHDSSLPRFFVAVEKLGAMNLEQQEQELQKLTDSYAARVQKLAYD